MKRYAIILLLMLSAFALLAAPLIPHHHHDDAVCAVMNRCEQDQTFNDEHTGHNASSGETPHCMSESKFTTSNLQKDFSQIRLFSFIISAVSDATFGICDSVHFYFKEYRDTYKPIDLNFTNGLRAPPYHFL